MMSRVDRNNYRAEKYASEGQTAEMWELRGWKRLGQSQNMFLRDPSPLLLLDLRRRPTIVSDGEAYAKIAHSPGKQNLVVSSFASQADDECWHARNEAELYTENWWMWPSFACSCSEECSMDRTSSAKQTLETMAGIASPSGGKSPVWMCDRFFQDEPTKKCGRSGCILFVMQTLIVIQKKKRKKFKLLLFRV